MQDLDTNALFASAGLIIRQKEPKNLETPFDLIDTYLTPTELFYIRSHFATPDLDRAAYQLRIDGAVRQPFALGYEELRGHAVRNAGRDLEMWGNSRVFLVPPAPGAQWELGAVGNADGPASAEALLKRADLQDDAWRWGWKEPIAAGRKNRRCFRAALVCS